MSINKAIPIFGSKAYFKEYFFSIIILSIAITITLEMEYIYKNNYVNLNFINYLTNNREKSVYIHILFIIFKVISIFIIYFISYIFVFSISYAFRTY